MSLDAGATQSMSSSPITRFAALRVSAPSAHRASSFYGDGMDWLGGCRNRRGTAALVAPACFHAESQTQTQTQMQATHGSRSDNTMSQDEPVHGLHVRMAALHDNAQLGWTGRAGRASRRRRDQGRRGLAGPPPHQASSHQGRWGSMGPLGVRPTSRVELCPCHRPGPKQAAVPPPG